MLSVAILGASPDKRRVSWQAYELFSRFGYQALYGIYPEPYACPSMHVFASLESLPAGVHTLTVYLRAEHCLPLLNRIKAYGFSRVIFNPGSDDPIVLSQARELQLPFEQACTLVLLRTGQF